MASKQQELIQQLLATVDDPSELLGDDGLFKQLKQAMMEKVLDAEMAEHLGYEKHEVAGRGSGNSRNGHNRKRVLTGEGELELELTPTLKVKRRVVAERYAETIEAMYAG